MKNLFSLEGKTAVVTGGSRGIGAMIARGFLDYGAKVYITARKAGELDAAQKELSAYGECVAIGSDLSTMDGIVGFHDAVTKETDKLDILVNNAGAAWGAPVEEYPESGWDKVMDLNVKSVFFLTQKFLPQLRAAGTAEDPARVVNIASINGITHSKMPTYAYSASKAAVIHMTKHLAADLAGEHVNVNGFAPGFFPSKMTAALLEEEEEFAKLIPRRRIGRPEDAAGVAIYLTSMASAWVTGHTVVVDGGMVAAAG